MKHCPTCKRNWASGRICPYCDCELVAGSSPAPCSPAHVRFELRTEQGNVATIKGDPNMPEATRKALAAMIDAAVTAANAGKLKAPENADFRRGDLKASNKPVGESPSPARNG